MLGQMRRRINYLFDSKFKWLDFGSGTGKTFSFYTTIMHFRNIFTVIIIEDDNLMLLED